MSTCVIAFRASVEIFINAQDVSYQKVYHLPHGVGESETEAWIDAASKHQVELNTVFVWNEVHSFDHLIFQLLLLWNLVAKEHVPDIIFGLLFVCADSGYKVIAVEQKLGIAPASKDLLRLQPVDFSFYNGFIVLLSNLSPLLVETVTVRRDNIQQSSDSIF